MKPYGHDIGCGWLGRIEDNENIQFPTEGEYDEYCDEAEN